MRLTIAYSKIKKRNLVLINNATHQREALSERPIRPPLSDQGKGGPRDPRFVFRAFYYFRLRFFHRYFF